MAEAWDTAEGTEFTDAPKDPFEEVPPEAAERALEEGRALDEEYAAQRVHTPPPLPPKEDGGTSTSRTSDPHRVPSSFHPPPEEVVASPESTVMTDQSFTNESSIFAHGDENPLVPHHHKSRKVTASSPAGGGEPPEEGNGLPPAPGEPSASEEDPFAPKSAGATEEDPFAPKSIPPLNLNKMGPRRVSRTGSIGSASGSLAQQQSLHDVLYPKGRRGSESLESRMISNKRRNSGEQEDPFAAEKAPSLGARTSSVSGSVGITPQIVSGGISPNSRSLGEGFTSEERAAAEAAEELFLPNMKREQFIPVRVARDKIKQVLSEMAQMRSLHLAALETMEKQHAFLKAQLESATATYVKKLTTDYNNRVTALEAEYKRRLDNLSSNAMGTLTHDMDQAKKNVALMEEKAMQKVKDRERELEQEQKIFLAKMEQDKKENEMFAKQVAERNEKIAEYENRINELGEMLAEARAGKGASSVDSEEKTELEDKVKELEANLHTESISRKAFEQQALELQEQLIEARGRRNSLPPEFEELKGENAQLKAELNQLRSQAGTGAPPRPSSSTGSSGDE